MCIEQDYICKRCGHIRTTAVKCKQLKDRMKTSGTDLDHRQCTLFQKPEDLMVDRGEL